MTARPFLPGCVDYDGAMSRNFNAARALSEDALIVWRAALAPYLAGVGPIIDVGSGTGRFTVRMAEWFGVLVVGVEPAAGMRDAAMTVARHPHALYVGGRAEQLPLRDESCAAALLSNVYHHLTDREACASELGRVLKPGGRVLVRGAFSGRLGGITLFDHFPEARAVCEQFPGLKETAETFVAPGLRLESVQRVIQQTCLGLRELAARTRLRADTTLTLMPDDAFAARQKALERAAAAESEPTPITDTLDLVVMRKVSV